MHFLNKSLAFILAFSLLGQSFAFANPTETNTPQTLAEAQAQAKQAIQDAPWIAREGKYILGAGGVLVSVIITQQILHHRQTKELTNTIQELSTKTQDLSIALNEADHNARVLRKKYANIAKAEKKISAEQAAQINHLQKQVAQKDRTIYKMNSRIGSLRAENYTLNQRLTRKKSHYNIWASYPHEWDSMLLEYEKLFDTKIPWEQRAALRNKLAQESWLTNTPKAQQKQFLHIIDTAMVSANSGNGKESASQIIRHFSNMFMEDHLPLMQRLIAFGRHIFHSKNLMAVAFVVALGASAQKAQAQEMANRINTNFDLFLNATPEQLAEMEKNDETRQICMQAAEAIILMSQLHPEDVADLLNSTGAEQKPLPNLNVNLAR